MNIEYKNYKIKQTSALKFDLIKLVEREKKETKEKYIAESTMGYDMQLENCCKNIVLDLMKSKEETTDLKNFLTEYKREKEELLKTIKLD